MLESSGKITFDHGVVVLAAKSLNSRQYWLDEIIMHLISDHDVQIKWMLNHACTRLDEWDDFTTFDPVTTSITTDTNDLAISVILTTNSTIDPRLVAQAIFEVTIPCVHSRFFADATPAKLGTNKTMLDLMAAKCNY